MARKVYYSKPLKYFWEHLYRTQKNYTPEYTDDQIFEIIRNNILNKPAAAFETAASKQLIVSGWEMWRMDAKGELLHVFFVDRDLQDFLENTTLSDLEGIKDFLLEQGHNRSVFHLYSNKQSKHIVFQFALHIPYESEGYAFSISVEEDGSIELYYSRAENGGRMSDKFYKDVNNKNDEISLTHSKMFRLAINTITYMSCFPECVADGVPKNLLERSENLSARNFSLQLSDKVKEIEGSNPSRRPHFRKGHFRHLRSKKFVNKQGQVVFVSETMVKAKAKTVSTSPEIDRFGKSE
ncbi:hypothetical protein E7Z59_04645 [Robertkochia marina]|uniref:Uncharacterized protein n=1 Tax=Robertkochia marina TaxID=1227945 RepID=A0A4S3M414_9FLAO|nr:hypothetical protein [Robertkochia marina]THD69620.1 hypothetical protein E7Z59_04645 [Robertkochia marina]TRZ40793.1 hypothetical protein D3A96_15320 [Robertkochia marina]